MKQKITIELIVKGSEAEIRACESAVDRMLDAGEIQDAITTAMRDEDDEDIRILFALSTSSAVSVQTCGRCGGEFTGEECDHSGPCVECAGIGWAIFDTGSALEVQRVDSCGCLQNDDEAIEAARKAGVPVDDDGRLPADWTEEMAIEAEKRAKREVAWWAWHDADSSRASADMETAEARCRAWAAGESDDGPIETDPRLVDALNKRGFASGDWFTMVHDNHPLVRDIEHEIGAQFDDEGRPRS